MTTDELMAHACPIIHDIGWAHFFSPEAESAAADLGIDLFTLYASGRGGVLGDVEPVVVASAFGYFNPEVVDGPVERGQEAHRPPRGGPGLPRLRRRGGPPRAWPTSRASTPWWRPPTPSTRPPTRSGLALYAGYRGELLVDDVPGRALQIIDVLRELRGSAHLVAAAGQRGRRPHRPLRQAPG